MNSNAGVWVKAETLKEIQYGYDAAMACVNEFKIPNDHPDPGAAADCINMAREGYEFIKKVTNGLDEQPIPVNQDDDMTFKEMLLGLFNVDFMTSEEFNTICDAGEMYAKAKQKFLSSPSPTPVKNDKKIIREFAFEIALRLTDTLDTVDCSSFSSVAKAVEKTLRQTIFIIGKDPTKTYEPIPDEQPPTPVQEGLREDENTKWREEGESNSL